MSENRTGMATKPKSFAPQPLVASPIRDNEGPQDPARFRGLLQAVASHFPHLKSELVRADMDIHYTPAGFVGAALATAAGIAVVLLLITWLLVRENGLAIPVMVALVPVYLALSFLYAMYLPKVKARFRARRMEQELVFAGRHMLIELKGGVPLFDSMLGISRDYGEVSVEFNKVVEIGA